MKYFFYVFAMYVQISKSSKIEVVKAHRARGMAVK